MPEITKAQIEALLLGKIVKVENEGYTYLNRCGKVKKVSERVDGNFDVHIAGTQWGILPDTITDSYVEGRPALWLRYRRKFIVVERQSENSSYPMISGRSY